KNGRKFGVTHRVLLAAFAATIAAVSLTAGLLGRDSVLAQNHGNQLSSPLGPPPRGIPGGVPGGIAGRIPHGIDRGVEGAVPVQTQRAWSEAVGRAPESPARYENDKSAPVAITDARIRTLSRDEVQQARGWAPQEQASSYAVGMAVTVTNNSEARVTRP